MAKEYTHKIFPEYDILSSFSDNYIELDTRLRVLIDSEYYLIPLNRKYFFKENVSDYGVQCSLVFEVKKFMIEAYKIIHTKNVSKDGAKKDESQISEVDRVKLLDSNELVKNQFQEFISTN